MDKQLLKAYIKTIVEDEVKRVLPELLAEAVSEIKQLSENKKPAAPSQQKKPAVDRNRLAQLMGMTYDGETLRATSTDSIGSRLPENVPHDADPEVVKAITRDYSQIMKAMKIV